MNKKNTVQNTIDPTESALTRYHLNRRRLRLLRLPPEILPVILYEAVNDDIGRLHYNWLDLGHICRDLRSAFLGMHALWARAVFDSQYPGGLNEMLRRAGNCPIDIRLCRNLWHRLLTRQRLYKSRERRAIALLSRARVVDISYPRRCIERTIAALAQAPHPTLEKLSLDVGLFCKDPLVSLDQPNLLVPNLRVLELKDVFIPIHSSTLTYLTLRWTDPSDTPVPNVRAFADMLCLCDNLEIVNLIGWIPDGSALQDLQREGHCITLPRLKDIHFDSDFQSILDFWKILDIPSSATLSIDIISLQDEPYYIEELLEYARSLRVFVAHTQSAVGISKISRLAMFYASAGEAFSMTLASDDGESGSRLEAPLVPWDSMGLGKRDFFLRFDNTGLDPKDMISFLEAVCVALQLRVENIDALEATYGFELDERDQDTHFLHTMFPAVTQLRLKHVVADVPYILSSSDSRGLRYYPHAQALLIDQTITDTAFVLADVERLIDAIHTRVVDHGRPLRSVIFEGEFPPHEFGAEEARRCFQRLKALVPHVRLGSLDTTGFL